MPAGFQAFGAASGFVGAHPAPPDITTIVPDLGDTAGGTAVEISGTNLVGTTGVTIGGTACTSVTVLSSTKVRAVTPAKVAGAYDVVLTTSSGSATLTNGFEAWNPSSISGARIYDPELGVTGAPVSAWADQGAGAKNLSQGTSVNRPVYAASRFAGRHALVCVGVSNASYLSLAAREAMATGQSVFWVSKHISTKNTYFSGYGVPLAVVDDSSGATYRSGPGFSADKLALSNYSNAHGAWEHREFGSGYNDGTPRVYGMTHDAASGDIKAYVNGAQVGATLNSDFDTVHDKWDSIGAGNGPLGTAFQGEIGAVIITETVLSSTEITKLSKWLRGRFVYGDTSFERTAPSVAWGPRDGARLVASRNGYVYMVGGWNPGAFPGPSDVTNEIWRAPASDLATWTKIRNHDATPADGCFKPAHYMPVFAMVISGTEYLYVIGSDVFTDATERRTVRRCPINNDGSLGAWQTMTAAAPWDGALSLHAASALGTDLHVVCGQLDLADPSTATKKHYKSTDGGATWTTLSDFPGAARAAFDLVEWSGKLWMACGGTYGAVRTYYNGVYSFDGAAWTAVVADGAGTVPAREYHATVVFDARLWILNGYNGANVSDAWSSTDGATWVQQTIAPWTASHADGVCVLSDCIVFGPGNGTITDGAGRVYKAGTLPFA